MALLLFTSNRSLVSGLHEFEAADDVTLYVEFKFDPVLAALL